MMSIDVRPIPRPGWDPLPGEGAVGVVGRVLVREGPNLSNPDLLVAELRFSEHATIEPHPGKRDAIVVCIAGAGFTSVGDETVPLREGQQVRWPSGIVHGLWTEGSTMATLMVEQLA
jgi:quercetin dioxygenase-like cupin family protein